METAAGRLGVAQKRLGTRKRVTVFEPGDRGLAGTHSLCEFNLRKARPQARPEQFCGNLELRCESVILRLDPGVGEQAGFQLLELDRHLISFARRSAISISERG